MSGQRHVLMCQKFHQNGLGTRIFPNRGKVELGECIADGGALVQTFGGEPLTRNLDRDCRVNSSKRGLFHCPSIPCGLSGRLCIETFNQKSMV